MMRHMLASILSCSTILRACPMLMVLLTGVSPFMGGAGEGNVGASPPRPPKSNLREKGVPPKKQTGAVRSTPINSYGKEGGKVYPH